MEPAGDQPITTSHCATVGWFVVVAPPKHGQPYVLVHIIVAPFVVRSKASSSLGMVCRRNQSERVRFSNSERGMRAPACSISMWLQSTTKWRSTSCQRFNSVTEEFR